MISKKDILDIVHKVVNKRHVHRVHRFIFPMRDWLVGIFLFLALSTAIITYDVILFSHYGSLDTVVKPNSTKRVTLDKDLMDKVIKRYEERQEEFARLRAFGNVGAAEEVSDETADLDKDEPKLKLEDLFEVR